MRRSTLLASGYLLSVLLASAAVADEKIPDERESRATLGGTAVINGTLSASSPTYARIVPDSPGTIDTGCNLAVMLSGVGDNVFYGQHCIEVTDSTPIEAIIDELPTTVTDTVLSLYCHPFDRTRGDANVIAYDDDGGVGLHAGFDPALGITLTPGNTYWLILSTFANADMGDYQITLSPNIVVCSATPVEPASWGVVKSIYR